MKIFLALLFSSQVFAADFTIEFAPVNLIGTILTSVSRNCPDRSIVADGAEVSKIAYPELYSELKRGDSVALYGETSTTFKLPNLMGKFLRGAQNGTNGWDPDQASRDVSNLLGLNIFKVGSTQSDLFKSHTHAQDPHKHTSEMYVLNPYDPIGSSFAGFRDWQSTTTAHPAYSNSYGGNTTAINHNTGGSETRPSNQSVLFCIVAGR